MLSKLASCLGALIILCCTAPSKPNFKVVEPSGQFTVSLKKVLGEWSVYVDINGSVTNVSPSTLSSYQLIVNYLSYNEKGEGYLLKNEADHYITNFFDDGFGGGFAEKTTPWTPNEVKEFKLSDDISFEDATYPTNQIVALISIRASDPFGNSFNEPIANADLTAQWHQVQTKLKNKLEMRKKRTGAQ